MPTHSQWVQTQIRNAFAFARHFFVLLKHAFRVSDCLSGGVCSRGTFKMVGGDDSGKSRGIQDATNRGFENRRLCTSQKRCIVVGAAHEACITVKWDQLVSGCTPKCKHDGTYRLRAHSHGTSARTQTTNSKLSSNNSASVSPATICVGKDEYRNTKCQKAFFCRVSSTPPKKYTRTSRKRAYSWTML